MTLAGVGAPALAQDVARPPLSADVGVLGEEVREALRARLSGEDAALARAYAARGFAPLWLDRDTAEVRPPADALMAAVRDAASHGLDPADYHPDDLAQALAEAADGDPDRLAVAELALSRTLVAYVGDLRRPRGDAGWAFVDPQLPARARDPEAILRAAGQGEGDPDLAALTIMNAIYDAFRAELAALRAGPGDPARQAVVLANLERARALPPDLGPRFILVDAAAGQLWLFDGDQPVTTMKVAVGKPAHPTPIMTGLIRHAIFNPYWNVPADLVRTTVARNVLAQGLGYLQTERMVVLSGYEDDAVELDPATLDWAAIERGDVEVRVRQRPGPRNMMGKVKLMLPNPLGIYLHDTPNKAVFAEQSRYVSSGCVRLEDALSLATLLLGKRARTAAAGEGEEQRVDLDEPLPVYITYFTAMPGPDGLALRRDIYGRDPALLAQLGTRPAVSASLGP